MKVQPPMPEPPPSPHPALDLLAIEDDRLFGTYLVKTVTTSLPDVTIRLACSLREGLDELARMDADLVLLDLGLPDSQGLSALDQIRTAGGDPAIIILTARQDEELALHAIRMGAQDYLIKGGLAGEVLVKAIRYALERKHWQAALSRAEARQRESEKLLASTLDSMKAAIAITDERGVLIAANAPWKCQDPSVNPLVPAWEEEGLDYAAFARSLLEGGSALALVAAGFLTVLEGQEPRFASDFQWGEGPDPTGFGITVYSFKAGGRRRIGIAIADITQRIMADLELVKAHAIKNLILENSTLGIAFVRRRHFEWANTRMGEVLGLSLAEVQGASTRIVYPDDASYHEMGRTIYPAMEHGERSDVTWQLRKGDGALFWCRMIGRPLDPANPDEGSVWMLEDITTQIDREQERLSLEVQLRHAQKLEAIGQLAAGIAHEINTPTQYIGDNTKFLAEAFTDVFRVMDAQDAAHPEPVSEALGRIREEADLPFLRNEIPKAIEQSLEGIARVTKIVRAMKDFSHPGSEQPVEMDLNRAIESTVTVCRSEWKYVADLVLDLDPALGAVSCFPNEMNQAVLNLVINAAHAIADSLGAETDAKGTITVSTARVGAMAEIRVRDTGTGIPEHVRPRIFDPFFTTKVVGKGTGQGLAIVHTVVVERHKGSVSFETELGQGSVFILRIPIAGPALA